MQTEHEQPREPATHNSITESENLAAVLAGIYLEAGLPEPAAWEASLADLECAQTA